MLKLLKVLCWIQFLVFSYSVNEGRPFLKNIMSLGTKVSYECSVYGKTGDILSFYQKKGGQEREIQHVTQLRNNTTNKMKIVITFESSDDGSEIYCVLTDELGNKRRESNKVIVEFDQCTETEIEETEENNVVQRDCNHEKRNHSPAKANFADNDTHFKHDIANNIDNTENETYFNHSNANKNIETLFHDNADLAFDEKLNHEQGTGSVFSNLYTLVISLLVIVLAIALLGVWLIRRRSHLPPSEEEHKEDEGIYTTAQVTYAVLDLQNSTTDYVSVRVADGQTPYAKIIGVYKPDLK